MIIIYFTILLLVAGLVLTFLGHYLRQQIHLPYSPDELLRYDISLNISAIGYGAFTITFIVLFHLGLMYLLMK